MVRGGFPMARWCYAVNVAGALAYRALMSWGYAARQPGGSFLATFAIPELAPYTVLAVLARHGSSSRDFTRAVLLLSLASAVLSLTLDWWAMNGVYQESLPRPKPGPE